MLKKTLAFALILFGGPVWAGVHMLSFGVSPGGAPPPSTPSTSNEVIFGDGFEPTSPNGSAYLAMPADVIVNTPTTLLSRTIYVPTAGWAYLQSDGRYYSTTYPTGKLAEAYIKLDGVKVSNTSTVDWSNTSHVSQRCFNAIATAYLTQGYHDVALAADGLTFEVGAGSNLSVMTNAASQAYSSSLNTIGGPYSFSLPSAGLPDGSPLLPSSVVLSQAVSTQVGQPVVGFASFSETNAGRPGDAMAAIYSNGAEPTLSQSTWTDNDGYSVIELRAPMYGQALFTAAGTSMTVSLNATLFPWSIGGTQPDNVKYSIDSGATLISLVGGMTVVGSALTTGETHGNEVHWEDYICVGSNQGWPGCPVQGTDVQLLSKTFTVPAGHSGVVLFSSKTRMQGDGSDTGGQVVLFLKLDGVQVGSTGVQGITSFDGDSERTLSTSYMSAADKRLSPGTHTIQVWTNAAGGFIHMSVLGDLPLIYFD